MIENSRKAESWNLMSMQLLVIQPSEIWELGLTAVRDVYL